MSSTSESHRLVILTAEEIEDLYEPIAKLPEVVTA
jgi:hypothetical protein